MELNIQSALLGDVSAVSALRCLQLYCQRLGLGGDSVEAEDLQVRWMLPVRAAVV